MDNWHANLAKKYGCTKNACDWYFHAGESKIDGEKITWVVFTPTKGWDNDEDFIDQEVSFLVRRSDSQTSFRRFGSNIFYT